jgi:toxin ParE1/3/4
MHQIVVDDVRRKLLHKFPYFLYYQVEDSRVAVIGLFHTSRDPQIWQDRIEEKSQDEPD